MSAIRARSDKVVHLDHIWLLHEGSIVHLSSSLAGTESWAPAQDFLPAARLPAWREASKVWGEAGWAVWCEMWVCYPFLLTVINTWNLEPDPNLKSGLAAASWAAALSRWISLHSLPCCWAFCGQSQTFWPSDPCCVCSLWSRTHVKAFKVLRLNSKS